MCIRDSASALRAAGPLQATGVARHRARHLAAGQGLLAFALLGHHLLQQRVALHGARGLGADGGVAPGLHARAGASGFQLRVRSVEGLVRVRLGEPGRHHAAERGHLRAGLVGERAPVAHAVHGQPLERAVEMCIRDRARPARR